MDLDESVELMEETGQTEAEAIDQETELEDYQSDMDEILGDEAEESDMESAYDSFITDNETDYDGYEGKLNGGWDDTGIDEEAVDEELDVVSREERAAAGVAIEDDEDLEAEVIEMEIEEGDIEAYIFDEDDNEIGFVLLEDGEEVEYYYVEEFDDEDTGSDEAGEPDVEVMRGSDEAKFNLGLTRDDIQAATDDLNSIYRDGKEVVTELKEAFDDITGDLPFIKKK